MLLFVLSELRRKLGGAHERRHTVKFMLIFSKQKHTRGYVKVILYTHISNQPITQQQLSAVRQAGL